MNEGVALIAEVEEWRIDKRLETRYLDEKIAGHRCGYYRLCHWPARAAGQAVSIGVLCNAVNLLERLLERTCIPDTLTDQTSAHDPLIGYWPHELSHEQAGGACVREPSTIYRLCRTVPCVAPRGMYARAARTREPSHLTTANNLQGRELRKPVWRTPFGFPGFVPRSISGRCFAREKAPSVGWP